MQIPEPVIKVFRRLKENGHKTYLVGGCVRDHALGKAPKDWDIATSATPQQVVELFPAAIPTGIEHGTVTVVMNLMAMEVTTFRTEGDYTDGRRPDKVEFVKDIDADLSRRDLTINAMAYDPDTKEYADPFGGKKDLEAGLIRCVRDPVQRFTEDGLRCMRAIRFATVLDFRIDPATEKAIGDERLDIFAKVANERKAVEFEKILMSKHPQRGLHLLRNTGLLGSWLPGIKPQDYRWFGSQPGQGAPYRHKLAMILRDNDPAVVKLAVERLKLSANDATRVMLLTNERSPAPACTDVEMRKHMARLSFEVAFDLFALDYPDNVVRKFGPFIIHRPPLKTTDLALDGTKIMAVMQAKPGKEVGMMARFLLEAVLEDLSLNTSESLTKLILDKIAKIG